MGPGGQHQSSVAGYSSQISRKALIKAAKSADISEKTLNTIIEEVYDVAASFVTTANSLGDAIPSAAIKSTAAKIEATIKKL